jgi:hypothetical protein
VLGDEQPPPSTTSCAAWAPPGSPPARAGRAASAPATTTAISVTCSATCSVAGGGARRRAVRTTARARRRPAADVHLTFEDALEGCARTTLRVTGDGACGTCNGRGARPGTQPQTCTTCGGRGQVTVDQGPFSFAQPCQRCGGRGTIDHRPVHDLQRQGRVVKPRQLTVRVPRACGTAPSSGSPGVADPAARRPSGDVLVTVHVAAHPLFGRKGDDVTLELPISFRRRPWGRRSRAHPARRHPTIKVPAGTRAAAPCGCVGRAPHASAAGQRGPARHRAHRRARRPDPDEKRLLEQLDGLDERAAAPRSVHGRTTDQLRYRHEPTALPRARGDRAGDLVVVVARRGRAVNGLRRAPRRRPDAPVYVISVAAELAGLHPADLRAYEREGLITPARTEGAPAATRSATSSACASSARSPRTRAQHRRRAGRARPRARSSRPPGGGSPSSRRWCGCSPTDRGATVRRSATDRQVRPRPRWRSTRCGAAPASAPRAVPARTSRAPARGARRRALNPERGDLRRGQVPSIGTDPGQVRRRRNAGPPGRRPRPQEVIPRSRR